MTVNELMACIGSCLAEHGREWMDGEVSVSRAPKPLAKELRRRGLSTPAPRKKRGSRSRDLPGQILMF